MNECEHFIGFMYDYDNSDLITLDNLIQDIKKSKISAYNGGIQRTVYKLEDYVDFRKSVNITRFRYCPMCGEKLDWKKMCNFKE